jgi:ornithine carbamoyltransferase
VISAPPVPAHFLRVSDLDRDSLTALLDLAETMRSRPHGFVDSLRGDTLVCFFDKPSTRTRVSFAAAAERLGMMPLLLRPDELQLGRGETIEDTGRVLSRYCEAIVLRTFGQERLEALAAGATVPVVNSLSDYEHPCQILADLLTVIEKKGEPTGRTLAYLGDGNNVAHSLLLGGAMLGMHVRVATPTGFEPIPQVVERAGEIASETGGSIEVGNDPLTAVNGADILYTDVWASMGQEREHAERVLVFTPFRIDAEKLSLAADDAIVMHCLPAHRGEEITDEVIDGPHSVVWDQAENRLHTQKALLLWLLGRE